jgi:hypothetical protein
MTGQTVILSGWSSVAKAKQLIDKAPPGAVVNVRPASRTNAQNDRMWAMLGDISRAKPEGRNLPPDIWKAIFMAACGHKVRFEPTLDGDGVIPIGFRSSRLTKAEMSELIEAILAYGALHGVEFGDER